MDEPRVVVVLRRDQVPFILLSFHTKRGDKTGLSGKLEATPRTCRLMLASLSQEPVETVSLSDSPARDKVLCSPWHSGNGQRPEVPAGFPKLVDRAQVLQGSTHFQGVQRKQPGVSRFQ